jgi:outer membrane protein assembly factor BamD
MKFQRIARNLLMLTAAVIAINISAQPKYILELNLNYGWPVSSLSDWRPAIGFTPLDNSYSLNFLVGFGGRFRYAIGENRNIRLVAGINADRLLNKSFSKALSGVQDNTILDLTYPSIGIEYSFNPFSRIEPFAGIDFTASRISGGMNWSPLISGISDMTLKPVWRYGIQLGAGADIITSKKISIVVGLKYHMANLFGKEADTTTLGNYNVNLNDDGYTYNDVNYGQTDINYIKLYVGVAYKFGIRKTTDKITEEEVSDIKTDDPQKAFEIARRKFDRKDYVEAIDDFSVMKIRFSGSGIDDKIQYYIAESYFMQKEYIFAEYEYKNFIKEFSQSILYADALYKLGLTYYYLSPKYSLDQDYSKLAITEFLEYLDAFPQDKNVSDAEVKVKELRDKLALKDYTIAVNYMKLGNNRSAAIYFEDVYNNYIESEWADNSMVGHAEALINGKKYDEAAKVLEKFYKLFPKSDQKTKADQLEKKIKDAKQ